MTGADNTISPAVETPLTGYPQPARLDRGKKDNMEADMRNVNIEVMFPFFFCLPEGSSELHPQKLQQPQLLLPPVPVVALLDWTGRENTLLPGTPCRTRDDG